MIKQLTYKKGRSLGLSLITICAMSILPVSISNARISDEVSSEPFHIESRLASLTTANAWLNSEPLNSRTLKGKVVLIQFCTYTCINWLRTLPYVRAWAEKYKDMGLVVIGVHTPEFAFEANIDNVSRAIRKTKIDFPVAIDNAYKIWNAFDNHYWPALYFIDAQGRVRHIQFGEGQYDEAEKKIQQLLAETGTANTGSTLVSGKGYGIEAAADWGNLRSPETYLGYERAENFSSGSGRLPGKEYVYSIPSTLDLHHWAISGHWKLEKQSVILKKEGGKIVFRFHARDLHLVMGPETAGKAVRFRVLLDGSPPGSSHGLDIDEQGNGTATEQRLYQLIRQPLAVEDHTFEIEFPEAGAEAFAFTFG